MLAALPKSAIFVDCCAKCGLMFIVEMTVPFSIMVACVYTCSQVLSMCTVLWCHYCLLCALVSAFYSWSSNVIAVECECCRRELNL